MKVFSTFVTLTRPGGNDLVGAIEEGFYTIHNDGVTLTDESGTPLASGRLALGYSGKVAKGQNHEAVAKQLIWRRFRARKDTSDFNRPLDYTHRGWR
jgi:hypothetical protein